MLGFLFMQTLRAEPSSEPQNDNPEEKTDTQEAEEGEETVPETESTIESIPEQDQMESPVESTEEQNTTIEETPTNTENNVVEEKTESTSPFDLSNAEELKDLEKKQIMWLRPLPERFDQNPYLHVDFTSYCLEWGEFQVGLNTLKAGILPRTQVGTSIPMWIIGLQNFDAKVNLLRIGAFDFAIEGNYLSLPTTSSFRMSLMGGGLSTSVRIIEPWTIHLGSQYMNFSAKGLPDLSKINPLIIQMSGVDADSYRAKLEADKVGFDINASALSLGFASDFRMNRRDSWILQAQGIIWHSIDSSSNVSDSDKIPQFLNVDQIFALQSKGLSDITKSYVVSIAHQWSWEHSYLRLGFGWSSMNSYAFVPAMIQSLDYAWRFGGKSKIREGKIRKGWKENQQKTDQNPPKNK